MLELATHFVLCTLYCCTILFYSDNYYGLMARGSCNIINVIEFNVVVTLFVSDWNSMIKIKTLEHSLSTSVPMPSTPHPRRSTGI